MIATPPPSELDRRFSALKESVADAVPPPATDDAIAAAIAHAARKNAQGAAPSSTRDRWFAGPLALAASIAALSFVVRSLPQEAVVAESAPAAMQASDEFMPVVPLSDIEGAGDTLVVPALLPRTTLAQLGLPINPARIADAVDTELLIRRDGSVLAVRFIY